MRKVYIHLVTGLLLLFISLPAHQQVSSYTFTPLAGSYTPITGTSPTFTGDGVNAVSDEGYANAIPIGFSFSFSGGTYTTVGVSTNGFISFGAALTSWGFTNSLSTGPAGSTTSRPLAAPLWDDMDAQATTNIQYTTTGTAPNRVFTMQWSNMLWSFSAATACMDFQVKLYETTNVVEFVYNQLAGTLSSATASIGLASGPTGSGNFLNLTNATASPGTSTTVTTNNINAKPATGQVYRFSPPSCSSPSAVASAITHNSATLTWSPVASATNYEYEVSTSATPPASGTSIGATTYNASGLSATTQYYFHIRTNCSGTFSGWSTTPFKTTFDCSTAEVISGCLDSKTVSLSGAGVYNTTACGFNTPGNERLFSFTPSATGNYTLNITAANGEYIDYFYKAASGGCGETGWTCIGDNNAIGADVFGPLTGGTTYYILLDAEDNSVTSTATFELQCPIVAPPNDLVCNAIALTLGGPQDCQNTTGATATSDPTLPGGCSTPNNTVWYTYTPASTGPVIIHTEIPGATSNPINGWVAIYTATGTCPTLTLTALAGSTCLEFGQTGAGDIDDLLTPSLTGGTTYYIMIDGFSGDAGEFCISVQAPPPPPACVTNIAPANAATGVVINPAPTFSWNSAVGATSYNVFFGTTNPPTTNIGNTTATSVPISGLAYNTTYYWYVQPVSSGGSATGCDVNTTSFTTENPTNCTPLYTTGCTAADSLGYFSLKGASGTAIYNESGATCNTTPVAYSDYTGSFSPVTLVRGETFSGKMRTGDPNDYATIWIDEDDDGFFEDNERVMNNLRIGTTTKLYAIYVPTTFALGTHRLRVRIIYSSSAPVAVTHPCNPYTYGETEDYLVDITNVGTSRAVATGDLGNCLNISAVTIDAASNNNSAIGVILLDSLNNYVARITPNGNNLGTVTASVYTHNGAVRQEATGRYYLDRNITINTSVAPTSTYNLRYYYLNSELNALIAQPGSGVTSQFDLAMTKNTDPCVAAFNNSSSSAYYAPTGFGSLGGNRFLDFVNISGFSSFYLHGGVTALPVTLTSFSGQREGAVNKLRWITSNEQNSLGFDVQRSADGVNYTSIGFVNSQAVGGNSSTDLIYGFIDNNVQAKRYFYRLRQVNLDQTAKLSNIVIINGNKPLTLTIAGVFPNPATEQINVLVDAPVRDNVQLLILDASGRRVIQKTAVIESGSNTVGIPVSGLANGTYLVKLVCSSSCEAAVGRFVKQ